MTMYILSTSRKMPGRGKKQITSNSEGGRDGGREGGEKNLLQYHSICNTSHTAHPRIDMDYKYTQLSHTYPHDGKRRLRSGTLLELRLKNARTLSSQRTILPRINIMGIVGNPTRRTNGSAFSITDKPSLWPTTWTENR